MITPNLERCYKTPVSMQNRQILHFSEEPQIRTGEGDIYDKIHLFCTESAHILKADCPPIGYLAFRKGERKDSL
jgi:hypothetical protein